MPSDFAEVKKGVHPLRTAESDSRKDMNWKPLLDAALDVIYPRVDCVSCGRRLEKSAVHGLCGNCLEFMPFIRAPRCSACGKPLEAAVDRLCPDCREYGHDFDQALSVFEYSVSVRELVHRYKYDKEFSLSRTLGFFLSELLQESGWQADVIVPVPLHKNRLKSRGFNQATLLGDYLSCHHGIPCMDDLLIRRIDTKTQTGFNRWERAENLRNAFAVVQPDPIRGKNILLIDDVYTTGATADSCSRVLRQSGAQRIYVLTIATGRNVSGNQ